MARKKMGYCVYCGKFERLTRDHIPPRCFFGDSPPKVTRGELVDILTPSQRDICQAMLTGKVANRLEVQATK